MKLKLSIFKIILYIILPFGQLFARIIDFNCSLDKWYLLFPIFNLFPFSIVPILLMAFGFIKPGNGGKPYDHFMWLPIITKFCIGMLCHRFIKNPIFASLAIIISTIISIAIPNIIRRQKQCSITKDSKGEQTFGLGPKQIFKSISNSFFELGFGYFFALAFSFIPFVGWIFKIITFLPIIGSFVSDIVWTLGFIGGYIIINILDQQDMNKLCYPASFASLLDAFKIVFGVVFIILGSVLSGGKFGKILKIAKIGKFFKKAKFLKQAKNMNVDSGESEGGGISDVGGGISDVGGGISDVGGNDSN